MQPLSTKTLSIRFISVPGNLRLVEDFVRCVQAQYAIDDTLAANLRVAVMEAVNNAICHGNCHSPSKQVHLSCTYQPHRFVFRIHDEGEGFDYRNPPDPTAPANLFHLGGRGIFLMKQLCSQVRFYNRGRSVMLAFDVDRHQS